MPELPINDIETALKLLPQQIYNAGQKVIEAEAKVNGLTNQIEIDGARIRLNHLHEELPAKMVEAYTIDGTKDLRTELVTAEKELEVVKLEHRLLEDKFVSVRKIANIRTIYSP